MSVGEYIQRLVEIGTRGSGATHTHNTNQPTPDRINGMNHTRPSVSLLLVALCSVTVSQAFAQTVDTIYHNGSILTMAGKEPAYVEALAVKDGKIALAGRMDAALKGPSREGAGLR
jgi:hypothetical protein